MSKNINEISSNIISDICHKCGKPFVYVGDVPKGGFPPGQEPWCTCYNVNIPNYGWICPICGSSVNPQETVCPNCVKSFYTNDTKINKEY